MILRMSVAPRSHVDRLLEQVGQATKAVWPAIATLARSGGPARVLFAGVEANAGTTLLALVTALDLARNSCEETTLIETCFETPAVARLVGLEPSPGFSDLIDGRVGLDVAVRRLEHPADLRIVTAGTQRPIRSGEFARSQVRQLLGSLTSRGSFVVLDAPPIPTRPDMRVLCEYADAAVLVVDAGHTRIREAKKVVETLENAGLQILGSVLNRFRSPFPLGIGRDRWR